jgi:gamma-glutamyltranspeptidase/glutathione hydrolase
MTTSNGEGSGYIVPQTGIMLNNMMGEDDLHPDGFHASPAGMRIASMMSPSLLLQDDSVKLVIGSGGSKRIRSAIVQVISNIVDFAMPLTDAVEAPRIHWDGDCAQLEPGFDAAGLDALQSRCPVNLWPERNVYFGGVHVVDAHDQSAGDPRRGGSAVVFD